MYELSQSHRYRSFGFLCVFSLVLWWQPLLSTLGLAVQRDEYAHILLVLPITAALISLKWKSPTPISEPNLKGGSVLLVLAILVGYMGIGWWGTASLAPDVQLSLSMSALVIWWIGSFVLCFGTRAFRVLLFPLCFLFWLVPFPEFLLDSIVVQLQLGSAYMAHLLFAAAGIPVAQNGIVLSIPGLTIEVAKNCSSIRSSMMLWVTTTVLAQLFLRSRWAKTLAIGVAIPLAVAKNGLRVFSIAMLTNRVDPAFMTGELHHDGGIVFFIFSLIAVFILLWILRRAEGHVLADSFLNPVRLQAFRQKFFSNVCP